jgi:hypothetical protein
MNTHQAVRHYSDCNDVWPSITGDHVHYVLGWSLFSVIAGFAAVALIA